MHLRADACRTGRPYRVHMANDAAVKRIVDVLIAVGFLAVGWLTSGGATTSDPFFRYAPRDWLFALLLGLATVPYAWRRRRPSAAFLISMLSTTVLWLLGYNAGALPLLLVFGGYFVAVARPRREVALCAGVAVGCFALLWWGGGAPYGAFEAFVSVLAVGITLGLGRAGRLRVDLANARAQAAEEVARRRSSEERLRIARELQDIIGHSLGTIAVQAGVGRHLMETEPEKAADALDNISRISRSSLHEVRTVVAVLREAESGAALHMSGCNRQNPCRQASHQTERPRPHAAGDRRIRGTAGRPVTFSEALAPPHDRTET